MVEKPRTVHPAVLTVAKRAEADRPLAQARLALHGVTSDRIAQAVEGVRTNSRLTLNFHPDRRDSRGRTVAAGLLADGRYRPQSETGISNGQRSAVSGGDRSRWETLLFDNVYDDVHVAMCTSQSRCLGRSTAHLISSTIPTVALPDSDPAFLCWNNTA